MWTNTAKRELCSVSRAVETGFARRLGSTLYFEDLRICEQTSPKFARRRCPATSVIPLLLHVHEPSPRTTVQFFSPKTEPGLKSKLSRALVKENRGLFIRWGYMKFSLPCAAAGVSSVFLLVWFVPLTVGPAAWEKGVGVFNSRLKTAAPDEIDKILRR